MADDTTKRTDVYKRLAYLDQREEGLLWLIQQIYKNMTVGQFDIMDKALGQWLEGAENELLDTKRERACLHYNHGFPLNGKPEASSRIKPDVASRVAALRVRGWDETRIREDIAKLG